MACAMDSAARFSASRRASGERMREADSGSGALAYASSPPPSRLPQAPADSQFAQSANSASAAEVERGSSEVGALVTSTLGVPSPSGTSRSARGVDRREDEPEQSTAVGPCSSEVAEAAAASEPSENNAASSGCC